MFGFDGFVLAVECAAKLGEPFTSYGEPVHPLGSGITLGLDPQTDQIPLWMRQPVFPGQHAGNVEFLVAHESLRSSWICSA